MIAPPVFTPSIRGILWMVFAALCFSVALGFVRHLSSIISSFEIVFWRQTLGFLLTLPWLARAGLRVLHTRHLKIHVLRATFGYVWVLASFYSVTLIAIADSQALQFTLPFFTIIFAMLFLKERVGRHRWIATFIGFAGALVILRPGFSEASIGMMMALAAAAFFAASDCGTRYVARDDKTMAVVLYSFMLQIPIAFIPVALTWTTLGLADWPAILALGLSSFGAQWGLSRALSTAEASLVSPVLFLRLPIVTAIGFVFFAVLPYIWTWLGALIIFAGTFYSARAEARLSAARAPT